MKRNSVVLAALGLLAVGISGCSNSAAPMTKDEQQNFKGGPMPESARKAFAEQQRKAEAAKNGGAPGPGGPTAPRPGNG